MIFARIRSAPNQTMTVGRWLLNAALTVTLAAIAFQLYATIESGRKSEAAYVGQQARPSSPHQVDADALADLHLLGLSQTTKTSAAPIALDSEIQVIGITAAEPPQSGWAILGVNGEQRVYGAGQTLPDGELLVAVQADRVVLEKSGNRYSLPLIMQGADPNARFRTLDVGSDGAGQAAAVDSLGSPAPMQRALPSTQQSLQDLRRQLLARPRLALPRKPSPPESTKTNPDL